MFFRKYQLYRFLNYRVFHLATPSVLSHQALKNICLYFRCLISSSNMVFYRTILHNHILNDLISD